MAVAVHVGVGVGGRLADEVEGILPAEVVEDRHEDEDADHDAVAHKLVRDDGLDEEREKDEGEDLREGHDVELLEVLEEFVMVVAGDGLHDNADEHGDGEQDELDEDNGGEAGEPVGGLAHGQSIVDAVEVGVALAPEQFGGIEGRDNEEEEQGAALDGLDHEVGDGPDVLFGDAAGEIAVVDAEGDEEGDDGPERNVAENVAQAQAGERDVLGKGGGGSEGLMDEGQASGDEGADGRGLREFLFLRFGGAAALGAGGERLDGHRERAPRPRPATERRQRARAGGCRGRRHRRERATR